MIVTMNPPNPNSKTILKTMAVIFIIAMVVAVLIR
jgi:hypothetical protein